MVVVGSARPDARVEQADAAFLVASSGGDPVAAIRHQSKRTALERECSCRSSLRNPSVLGSVTA